MTTSPKPTKDEALKALDDAISMIDNLNSAYGSDEVDTVARAGREALAVIREALAQPAADDKPVDSGERAELIRELNEWAKLVVNAGQHKTSELCARAAALLSADDKAGVEVVSIKRQLVKVHDALSNKLGDSNPAIPDDITDEEVAEEMPVFWAAKEIAALIGDAPWDQYTSPQPQAEALEPRELRVFLQSMQAGEMSVGRAVEILDAWVAGKYSDDMVPPPPEDSCLIKDDEFPMQIVRQLRAAAPQAPEPSMSQFASPDDLVAHMAHQLTERAAAARLVVTIEHTRPHPLAKPQYVVETWPVRQ